MLRTNRRTAWVVSGLIAAAVVATTAWAVSGSGEDAHTEESGELVRLLAAPAGSFFDDPVWLPEQRRLVAAVFDKNSGDSHLVVVPLDGTTTRPLQILAEPGCPQTNQQFPARLPDGRLGFLQYCLGNPARLPRRSVSLRAYDGRSGEVTRLVPYFLPFFSGRFSYGATIGSGVINDGRGLSERLQRLTARGLRPIKLPWARAGQPAWSRSGDMIAVDGVKEADAAREPTVKRMLYLLDPSGRPKRTLLRGISDTGRPAWSPDGRQLALRMKPENGPTGVYVVSVATGAARLLTRGDHYGGVTWLPGGRSVVAARGIGAANTTAGLAIIQIARQ